MGTASDYREEIWNVAGYEGKAAFDLRNCRMDLKLLSFLFFFVRVHELIGEDEAGYADCCNARQGKRTELLGGEDGWGVE